MREKEYSSQRKNEKKEIESKKECYQILFEALQRNFDTQCK